MKRIAAFILAIAASSAQAHAKLESSVPKASSVVDVAPKSILLQFNEVLEPAFSKIDVSNQQNDVIAVPKTVIVKENPKAMSVSLPPLHSGQYHVQWSAVGHDGHKIKGEFTFRVK
jgi:methionine-rich copper-binding protein CopC